ncbi:TIGR03936 family radical SAM-associated protein [Nocardioides zeae]|uniref:TIGR03936 family radical SAM-associated protein n=1 Tax=Nocardioides imazamoxiresistens TaxID=3231893 RepID=A0ABU3PRH4_9ACTN|nr:TIGR03936 family radical SAM-associated protein [Nocardioides zeae]MDT9591834.1 TIGR03936 family radical SAM-associated protein [Nocardioides zeae]
MREQPEQQAPPVQRLRIRYAKRGRLRFTSHRDFSRAFERAIFRARVPMAYSSGFNPHPRISYANAAPTGSASEAEYLEIALAQEVDAAALHGVLDEALPDGLDVVEVVESPGGSLADLLQASRWRIGTQVPLDEAREAVGAFLATPSVLVERMTKKGVREFDCRAAVVHLAVVGAEDSPGDDSGGAAGDAAPAGGAELDLLLRHGVPSVRPDDVLTGLRRVASVETGDAPRLTRLAQGPFDEETATIGDPLATTRA